MNRLMIVIVLIAVPYFFVTANASLDARGIMEKNDEARKIKDAVSTGELKTFGGDKKDNAKTFTWWRKLQTDRVHYNTLTRFHTPATIRGQGILFQERTEGENEIQLYLPTFKKIRRVENQEQSGSFMGSIFSYSDMTVAQLEDYKYTLLKETECPVDSKAQCYLVDQTPAKSSIKERFGYSRWTNWIRKDNFMVDQREYYDLDQKLVKRLIAKDTKIVDAKEKRWMSFFLRMDNLQTKRASELSFKNVKVNSGIADAIFSQQNLQRAD
jgi:hypothetical protein